jgi:hypothetical protein
MANDEDERAVIAFSWLNKDLEELRREGGIRKAACSLTAKGGA